MQELLNSMIRLSTAVTVFGMQQIQSAVGSVDTKESMDKIRDVIDGMANAVTSKIDESSRSALDKFSNLPDDMLHRSWTSPHKFVQNTSDMVQTTSDLLKATVKTEDSDSSEPKSAAEVLSTQ